MTYKISKTSLLTLIFIIAISFSVIAQVPERPDPPRLVNDFASLLSTSERDLLEQKLLAYNDSTSTQITVVIMPSLEGYDPDDMAQRIGQKWGVGQKNTSNGLVILIKPKNGNERGVAAISTGYGLEEYITDAVSRQIVDNEMIPFFRNNQYFEGINAGVDVIADLLMGKYKAEDYAKGTGKKGGGLIFVIIFIIFIIIALGGKNKGDNNHTIGKRSNLPFWLLLSMMGSGRGSGGQWGGFSGGSGGFGGGGGFGGFGGGGFGGGGASGSW
jgi:uncharacterized protein